MNKKQIGALARLHGYWLYRRFLRHSREWSAEQRETYILQRLRTTLVRAYEGVPFYREQFQAIGFDPARDFRSPSDLVHLPLLTKADVRASRDRLVDKRYRWNAVEASTSGTTGEPTPMLLNESYIAFDYATMFRYWAQAGYAFRDRFLALRSFVPQSDRDPLWRYDALQNTLFMSAYHLAPSNADQYVRELLRFRPKFIRGYPSSLNVLAEYAEPYREQLTFVQGLFTASETLLPTERETIERTFGKKLFDWYGMTEPVLVITEGPAHAGMDVNWEYGYAEFLPSPELGPGEFRLVATSFHNPVMPFIRYDTGDVVRLCGPEDHAPTTSLADYPPRIHSIAGRKDECIVTPDGRRLPSVNFYTVFRDRAEVLRFQLVQYGLSDLVVKLSLRPEVGHPGPVLDSLRESLQVRVGGEVQLDFEITDAFITNADGKTPTIVRRSGSRAVEENQEYVISSQQAWLPENAGIKVLKLDWNEADWTPARDEIRRALHALIDDPRYLNWYPAADAHALTSALSAYTEVPATQLLVTHGSDGGIEALGVAFVTPGDRVMIVQPTYDNFRSIIEQHGAVSSFFRYEGTDAFPVDEFCHRLTQETPRLVYLTNPNNPIGYALSAPTLERIIGHCAAARILVVVDEAYYEFCGTTVAPLTDRYPNVLVLRTFSKAFGLAGLRLGYMLGSPDLIRVLRRVVNPKNVTMFAKTAALTALEHSSFMHGYVREVAASRAQLQAFLASQGIPSYPSSANFILFRIDRPQELLDHFAAAKVFVRDRSRYFAQGGHVRMTVGTLSSTARVIEVFDEFLRTRSTAVAAGRDEAAS